MDNKSIHFTLETEGSGFPDGATPSYLISVFSSGFKTNLQFEQKTNGFETSIFLKGTQGFRLYYIHICTHAHNVGHNC